MHSEERINRNTSLSTSECALTALFMKQRTLLCSLAREQSVDGTNEIMVRGGV